MNINLIPELGQAIYDAATSGKLRQPEALTTLLALFPNCPYCGKPGIWGAVVTKEDGTFGAALIAPTQFWHGDFVTKELASLELRRRGHEIERSSSECSGRLNW